MKTMQTALVAAGRRFCDCYRCYCTFPGTLCYTKHWFCKEELEWSLEIIRSTRNDERRKAA